MASSERDSQEVESDRGDGDLLPAGWGRLKWWVAAAVIVAFVGSIIPWALTRNDLAPGWTAAKVQATIRACDHANYSQAPTGAVSAGSCRCVTDKASHTLPLDGPVAGESSPNAQVEIDRYTATCNRLHPAQESR